MEEIKIDNWMYDMGLNKDGHIEATFTNEGKTFVFEVTESDARGLNHIFEMEKMRKLHERNR